MEYSNSSLVLLLRYSRVTGERYFVSTTIAVAEVIKVITCIFIIRFQEHEAWKLMYHHIFASPMELIKVAFPSILYAIQNNLLFYALTHLQAPHYQVTYQLKVFTTALFSILLLGTQLSVIKWVGLTLLFFGVCLIQLDAVDSSGATESTIGGSVAVLTATITSGLAGTYFEKILKESPVSVWMRNLQLGSIGMIVSLLIVLGDHQQMYGSDEKGFFFGWNYVVIAVAVNQALSGFIVALVVKYADNILKGFAVSFSIILSSLVSIFLFDFVVSFYFLSGSILVMFSLYLYQLT
eukprot:TRINITY_DN5078_c0_g2_i3.p1 TRINITY_DN5078_c0_g2~~TRINITY_DN5078_c0_g2_i3.p1  ORF type:complete len:294 (+),score=26.82 TRINITY_DN5078_c0_g2_i3:122-1003(+)